MKQHQAVNENQDTEEAVKGFEEMNINADADIPGNTHLSNPEV